MMFRSIGTKLTLCYTAILAGTLLLAGVGAWLGLRSSIEQSADRHLRIRSSSIGERLQLELHDGDKEQLSDELDEEAIGAAGGGLRILDSKGNWLYRSPAAKHWQWEPPKADELPPEGHAVTLIADGQLLRVLSVRAGENVIQVSFPLDVFSQMLATFARAALLGSPLLLALAAAGGHWMSRRALRPVKSIVETVKGLEAENLSGRLALAGTHDEIDQLADTINAMLARLERSFLRMRQFSADASHELRTPIAIVRTTAEVVSSKPRTPEEQQNAWATILTQTERTSRLIDDLLVLARADEGTLKMGIEAMDLAEIMRTTCSDVQVLAQDHALCIIPAIPAQCPYRGDSDSLCRLMLILLDNAIKYTPKGGTIWASLEVYPASVTISIRDTGVGVPNEDLPLIFDRFYRTSKDRSRQSGGAGLGLAIAKSIVRAHRGEISMASELHVGSTVSVRLPLS